MSLPAEWQCSQVTHTAVLWARPQCQRRGEDLGTNENVAALSAHKTPAKKLIPGEAENQSEWETGGKALRSQGWTS